MEIMIKQQNIVSNNFNLDIVTALGLNKSILKEIFILSFCFLVARYYIRRCCVNETMPTFKTFVPTGEGFTSWNAAKIHTLKRILKLFFRFLINKYYIVLNLLFAIPNSLI